MLIPQSSWPKPGTFWLPRQLHAAPFRQAGTVIACPRVEAAPSVGRTWGVRPQFPEQGLGSTSSLCLDQTGRVGQVRVYAVTSGVELEGQRRQTGVEGDRPPHSVGDVCAREGETR